LYLNINTMKFKEILTDVFDNLTITMILSLLVCSFLFFWLIDDTILESVKDSLIITIAMIIFVIFGRYVEQFK